MCVGGMILPIYKAPKPPWFKDDYETRTLGPVSKFLSKGENFSGSNMIWRKEVLEEFGGFDVRLGVKGVRLAVGEETMLFERIWSTVKEPLFYYSPELKIYHVVPAWKMKVYYQLKRAFSTGQCWYLVYGPTSFQDRITLFVWLGASIIRKTIMGFKELKKYPHYQNWLLETFRPIARDAGRAAACVGINVPFRQR